MSGDETGAGVRFLANAGLALIALGVLLILTIVGAAVGLPLIALGIMVFGLAIVVEAIQS